MKKKILCLAMIALMVIGTPLTANAEHFEGSKNWEVTFDGKKLGGNLDASDMRKDFLQILPGDSIELQVNLKNIGKEKTDWYMSNKVVETLEKDANAAQGGAYTYKLTYNSPAGEEVVFFDSNNVGGEKTVVGSEKTTKDKGLLEVNDELEKYFYLDRLKDGESASVTLYIQLDGETQGNDYQDTLAKLQMNFAVEKVNDKTITKEIKKEGKDEVIVVTKYVPGMVKTGDNSKLVLFSSLALVSGLGLLVYAFVLMKKRREGEE